MDEKPIWILNLDEIVTRTVFSSDPDVNTAVRAAYRHHQSEGRGVICTYEVASFLYPDLADAAAEATRRGFTPMIGWPTADRDYVASYVRDWLAEVAIHSPRNHRAILNRRMSFAQMIDAARRWHESMQRAAERLRNRAIERDDVGAPTVLDLDGEFSGWRWVWLKSDEARDAEGQAMGNCVGRGYYDGLGENAGVFSLRDASNAPHVTVEIDGLLLRQAECRGGANVSDRFRPLVDRMVAIIGLRLEIHGDPTLPVADGVHVVDGILAGDRTTYHVEDGVLHRVGGPARLSEGAGIYYNRGVEVRSICVCSERREPTYYACKMVDNLFERLGDDRYYSVVAGRYRLETRVDIHGEILDHRWSGRRNAAATAARIRRVPPAVNAPTPEVRP